MLRIYVHIILLFLLVSTSYSQYKSDFRVNDDNGSAYQNAAKLDVDTAGNFVVVWQDQRNIITVEPTYDVFCQRFNYKGEALGNNFKVNLNDSAASDPNIAVRKDGSFIIIWREGKWSGYYIDSIHYYLRIFNKNGNPITNRIIVNDIQFECPYGDLPSLEINNKNEIYVVMALEGGGMGRPNIFLQKLDSLGNKIGNNIKVNDDTSLYVDQNYPVITNRNDNSFIIVWQDNRLSFTTGNVPDIFMQKYNSIGQKVGVNIKVNDDPVNPDVGHWTPSISSDSSRKFCIVWADSRQSGGSFEDIYVQLFDSSCNLTGSNFRINGGFEWDRGNPQIKKRKDGYFIIGWGDAYANGAANCPYFQRFSNLNNTIGTNHWITNYNPSQAKAFSDIAVWNDRIISVWGDYRNGNCDIFCNIRSFQNPDSIISYVLQINNIPNEFRLFQNFPNPFNPVTKIKFDIPALGSPLGRGAGGMTVLKVYDILGKEIETLVNEKLNPGTYEVTFNASQYPSGVYFYRLQVGDYNESRKMLLIK
jgi:hypothetical protein